MDFEKFEALKAKYAEPVRAYTAAVQLAEAKVAITEAKIAEVERQRMELAGRISHEVALERQRIDGVLSKLKRELNDRKTALGFARAGGEQSATEAVNHIVKGLGL